MLFYILLGAVMDELAMLLLTLPVFFPIVQALDFGMPPDEVAIWFGILVLIVVGIGLTAPPIGLNVFVDQLDRQDGPIATTYRGVLPFIATDILRLGLVILSRASRCGWCGCYSDSSRPSSTYGSTAMAKKGYWIAHVNITNPERYKDYVAANAAPLKKYGARFIVRNGECVVREGSSAGAATWSSSSTATRSPRPATTRPNTRRPPRSATRPAAPSS